MTDQEVLMTTEDVAAVLQVTVETVREWARTGRIRASRIGKEYRYRRADVDAYVDHRVVEVAP